VLVNPGVAVSTGRVFADFDTRPAQQDLTPEGAPASAAFEDVVAWLKRQRNDLEAPAAALAPEIAGTLGMLRAAPEPVLARLSGSGATCFALCRTTGEAVALAVCGPIGRTGGCVRAVSPGRHENALSLKRSTRIKGAPTGGLEPRRRNRLNFVHVVFVRSE
jgi:4-diphosphocytidyl-2C-methyl-D-erythritol kinase